MKKDAQKEARAIINLIDDFDKAKIGYDTVDRVRVAISTAISERDAEIARLTGQNTILDADGIAARNAAAKNLARAESAEARVVEMEKALEPLQHLANAVFYVDDDGREMNAGKPDDATVWGFDSATLTYGDLRAARSALTK